MRNMTEPRPVRASLPSAAGTTPRSATGIASRSSRGPMSATAARQAETAATSAPAESTMESHAAALPERRSGTIRLSRPKDKAGASQAQSAKLPDAAMVRLAPEEVQVVRHRGAADPVDEDDQGQAQRHLRHRDADGEHGEDHPGDVAQEAGEGHQVDVDRVEHQLDAEQDADGVSPGEHAEQPDAEEHGGQG